MPIVEGVRVINRIYRGFHRPVSSRIADPLARPLSRPRAREAAGTGARSRRKGKAESPTDQGGARAVSACLRWTSTRYELLGDGLE